MKMETEYLRIVKDRFASVKELGDKAIAQVSEEDIHWRANKESNSIAAIVKHVSGNMISRWTDFLHADGEKPNRNREEEFVDTIKSKSELTTILEKGWNTLFETLNHLEEIDLMRNVTIRGEKHPVIEAIEIQIAHYAYHVGQIVYIGKQIKGGDWDSLSIPKGKSEEYLQQMLEKHQSK
ncbi:DUF1572 family protein [Ectobacillus sp. sgz5001026]|uniref:DUF1572 family protein n=1 Tax=Ectobacillus sp. sgz5001026 TaxID=3242473 RepID=UPI0036D3FDDA